MTKTEQGACIQATSSSSSSSTYTATPPSLQQGWSISNNISQRFKFSVLACGAQRRWLAWLLNLGGGHTVGSRTSEALLPHLCFPPSLPPSALLHISASTDTYVAFGVCQRGSGTFFIYFCLFHSPSFLHFFFLSRLPRISASAISSYPSVALFSPSLLSSPPIILRVKLICVAAEAGVGWGPGWGQRRNQFSTFKAGIK